MGQENIQVPDGKGGYKTISANKFSDGAVADVSRQQKALDKEKKEAHEHRIGSAAEAFNKYHQAYATDYNLSEEELVKALYLEALNVKEFYPVELGGKERVDELCQEAFDWFEENKSKT